MVKLTKIYTRGGDNGETSLTGGDRVPKNDPRVEAYGTVDELNAALGIVCLHLDGEPLNQLKIIQNDLFDLGADLSTPFDPKATEDKSLRMTAAQATRLEKLIDSMNDHLEPLTSFVLPGGTPASSYLHLARTIARRAERDMVAAMKDFDINPDALIYLNRLSDYLFVLGRFLNDCGKLDVLWIPGHNR